MMWTIIGFAAGLLIGWNVLPQPMWVQKLWNKAEDKVEEVVEDIKEK